MRRDKFRDKKETRQLYENNRADGGINNHRAQTFTSQPDWIKSLFSGQTSLHRRKYFHESESGTRAWKYCFNIPPASSRAKNEIIKRVKR